MGVEEKLSIEELIVLAEESRGCYMEECPNYRKFDQCHNHSHVLCPDFESFYMERKEGNKSGYDRES